MSVSTITKWKYGRKIRSGRKKTVSTEFSLGRASSYSNTLCEQFEAIKSGTGKVTNLWGVEMTNMTSLYDDLGGCHEDLDLICWMFQAESDTARLLREMMQTLGIAKPPAGVTVNALLTRVNERVNEILKKVPAKLKDKPCFNGHLSEKQWGQLEDLNKEMRQEYLMRREMLLKRLDVTVQSFHVSVFYVWCILCRRRFSSPLLIFYLLVLVSKVVR